MTVAAVVTARPGDGGEGYGAGAWGDHLGAERLACLFLAIHADHGEEQRIRDADRQEQVGVDARVGQLAERGRAGPV